MEKLKIDKIIDFGLVTSIIMTGLTSLATFTLFIAEMTYVIDENPAVTLLIMLFSIIATITLAINIDNRNNIK